MKPNRTQLLLLRKKRRDQWRQHLDRILLAYHNWLMQIAPSPGLAAYLEKLKAQAVVGGVTLDAGAAKQLL